MYLALLMIDGYEETDWPMQYTHRVSLLHRRGRETQFDDLDIFFGTADDGILFCPNEQYFLGRSWFLITHVTPDFRAGGIRRGVAYTVRLGKAKFRNILITSESAQTLRG